MTHPTPIITPITPTLSLPRFEGEFSWKWAPKAPWYKFRRQKIILQEPFTYWWKGKYPIKVCDNYKSDGFSIPLFMQVTSANQFTNFMEGVQASVLHDFTCDHQLFDKDDRVHIFEESLDVLNVNDTNHKVLSFFVKFGSKLGYC